jgi:para-aminobenzoate synthetase component 1
MPSHEPLILLRDDLTGREIAFAEPSEIIRADDAEGVFAALDRLQAAQSAGKWSTGYFAYEAGYAFEPKLRAIMPEGRRTPLVLMAVFDAPVERAAPQARSADAALSDARATWSFEDYVPRSCASTSTCARATLASFARTRLTIWWTVG